MVETIRKSRRLSIVAVQLGCNKSTIFRMLEDGRLQGFRIGHRVFVYLDSIKKYQADNDFVADAIDRPLTNW